MTKHTKKMAGQNKKGKASLSIKHLVLPTDQTATINQKAFKDYTLKAFLHGVIKDSNINWEN
ncbi:hypothetical protein AAHH67_28110 [Niallia circulans]